MSEMSETKKVAVSRKKIREDKKPTCGSCRFFWKGTVGGSDPRCVLDDSHVNKDDDACSRWAPKREKKSWRKQQRKKPKREFWPVQRMRE